MKAIRQYRAVYFGAVEGAAALLASTVLRAEVIAYPDLGPEAIYRLEVQNFPALVIHDIYGGDLYEEGRLRYSKPEPRPARNEFHEASILVQNPHRD